jgi:hypothetical protein
VDLVIVVREATREKLVRLSNPLQIARFSARIEAMILVEAEIAAATDCFPLLYDDIRRHHVGLYGKDPFADPRSRAGTCACAWSKSSATRTYGSAGSWSMRRG